MNVALPPLPETKNTLTAITECFPKRFEFHGEFFYTWLQEQGISPESIRHYVPAAGKWIGMLNSTSDEPGIAWLRWKAPTSVKRLTGFAIRKYELFVRDVLDQEVHLDVSRKLPPSTRPRPHPFSESEIRSLLQTCKISLKKPHARLSLRIFIHVVCTLGLRRQEVFFEWDKVDFENQTLVVLGKGGDRRTLPLTPRLVRVLKFWRRKSPSFPLTTVRGKRVLATAMYQNFKKVAREAGLPAARLHWFRHTRPTAMASAPSGYDPIHLAAFAGHRQLSSLLHYCQPSMFRLRALLESSQRQDTLSGKIGVE